MKGLNYKKERLFLFESSSFKFIELRYESRPSSDQPETV